MSYAQTGHFSDTRSDREVISKNNVAGYDIRVEGTKEEIKAVESQLTSNFDKEELRDASKNGISITFKELTKEGIKKIAGRYLFKTHNGREQILIDVDAAGDHETITHEMTHLCRHMDPNRKGFEKSRVFQVGDEKKIREEDIPLEEALTVAETIARVDPDQTRTNVGYYTSILTDDKQSISREKALIFKNEDIATIKKACQTVIIKREYPKKIVECFNRLRIKHLGSGANTAWNRFKELRRQKDGNN
ncbi:MAG: hypothetical protein MJZ38_02165 [archaeon]|nr:hypothetical protein [archaeon]